MKRNILTVDLLKSRATTGADGDCWLWRFARNRKGYGQIRIHSVLMIAHRAMWMVKFGPIPEGLHVCHTCDNPGCINPSHLFLGTNEDNVRDRTLKLRGAKKLTPAKVLAIRSDTRPQTAIAADYGVGQQTVSDIKRNRIWGHVS